MAKQLREKLFTELTFELSLVKMVAINVRKSDKVREQNYFFFHPNDLGDLQNYFQAQELGCFSWATSP